MAAPPLPLSGVRVLEAGGGLAAAFCGRQFAAWGAEVAVTRTQFAATALAGPTLRTADGTLSLAAVYLGAGKHVLPDDGAGRLAGADIVLGGYDAPFAQDGWVGLRRARVDAVLVSISPYGLSGPLAGQPAVAAELEARSGYLGLNGPADGPPIPSPARLMDYAIGASAFVGALGGLIRQMRFGAGELVEICGLETVAAFVPFLRDQQQGAAGRCGGTPEGARLLPCSDGYVSVAPAIAAHLEIYREVLGVPEDLAIDLGAERLLGAGVDQVAAALAPFSARLSMEEVFLGLQVRGVVCGKVQSLGEVLSDRQLEDLASFEPLAVEAGLDAQAPSARIRLDGRRPEAAAAPLSPWPRRPPSATAATDRAPLDGLRVLDLTQAWIGPICGVMLADLGAEVLKVEGPQRPDIWRFLGQADPDGPRPWDTSCYFNSANRNKLGVTVDLASPAGADRFLGLVRSADLLIENFTPRVLPRLGLGPERLLAENPQLVMTSFSGFGAEGPHADFKANGSSIEALAGWDILHRDHLGRPTLMGGYPADPMGGLQMAAVTLIGLCRRLREGRGAHMEGSMLESACGYIGDELMAESLRQRGLAIAKAPAPARVEPEAGEDRWRVVAEGRSAQVRSTLEVLDDPHLAARGWFLTLVTDGQGQARHPGRFWRLHSSSLPAPSPPPRLGEHTEQVLVPA